MVTFFFINTLWAGWVSVTVSAAALGVQVMFFFNEKPIKARNPDGGIPRETAWFCIHTRANALPTRAETRKGH